MLVMAATSPAQPPRPPAVALNAIKGEVAGGGYRTILAFTTEGQPAGLVTLAVVEQQAE